jgi:hypothetical protein
MSRQRHAPALLIARQKIAADSGHLCPRNADNYRDGCAGRSTITVARFLFLPRLVLRKPLNKLAI